MQPLPGDYLCWLLIDIRRCLARARAHDAHTPSMDEGGESVMVAGRSALVVPFSPCCVHQDYMDADLATW